MRCPSSSPSYQSGIGVRAIRMTARIAPTNAAAPMTANTFLPSFFFAALQISAPQAMQTAAAKSAMPSVSHSHESSCSIFMRSSSPSVCQAEKLDLLYWMSNNRFPFFRGNFSCVGQIDFMVQSIFTHVVYISVLL